MIVVPLHRKYPIFLKEVYTGFCCTRARGIADITKVVDAMAFSTSKESYSSGNGLRLTVTVGHDSYFPHFTSCPTILFLYPTPTLGA
jgi:hypothetical protein